MVVVSSDSYDPGPPAPYIGRSTADINRHLHSTPSCNSIGSTIPSDVLLERSPKKILHLLTRSIKEQNIAATKKCIFNLDQNLDQFNVLSVFSSLSKFTAPTNNNHGPTAPPLDNSTDWSQDLIQDLKYHCLLIIDKYADFILRKPEILQLHYNDLLGIVERDTFQVSNECLVYVTIYKWAVDECRRRKLEESNPNSLRLVLQRLQFSPRYGLMSKQKFTSKTIEGVPGPTRSGILEEKDWRLIKFYIQEKSKDRPVKDLPHNWSVCRAICQNNHKRLSSACSSPTTIVEKRNTCEKCIINFLTCWTAVFD